MSGFGVGLALAGWIVAAIVAFILPGRTRKQTLALTQQLRAHVEPYLRRRAAELQLDSSPTLPSQPPAEVVFNLCQLANQIVARERVQPFLGDTMEMAMSQTLPLDTPTNNK
jgi:hypothetical protein